MKINVPLFDRLRSRFDIRADSRPFFLYDGVFPVMQIGDVLKTVKAADGDLDLTGTAGTYVAGHTVPSGKRWEVYFFVKGGSTGSAGIKANISGVVVDLCDSSTGILLPKDSGISLPLPLEESDSIGLGATANGGDGNIDFDIVYTEEDLF